MNGVLYLKLHENKEDFLDLIALVSEYYNLSPAIIEKDYWVTKSLYLLSKSEAKDYAIFKGGTSLTKCYKDLKRFSEDIDIGVLKKGLSKRAIKKRMKEVETVMKDSTFEMVKKYADNEDCRESEFKYNSLYKNNLSELHKHIRFEIMSFLEPIPYTTKTVTSFIQDYLYEKNYLDAIQDNNMERFELNVLSISRTLLEKIVSLVRMSYEDNFIELKKKTRHLYDVHMLYNLTEDFFLNKEELLKLVETVKTFEEKSQFGEKYPSNKKWYESNLIKILGKSEIKKAYEEVFGKEFVYGDLPNFEDVIETFNKLFSTFKELGI